MSESKPFGPLPRTLLHVPVPWVFVLTYLVGVGLEAVFHPTLLSGNHRLLTPIGIVIFTLGAALAAWDWFIFHRVRTTRVPGEASTTLVNWGPYRFTRNPMYVGLSVAYLGEAAILHQIVPAILLPLALVYLNQVVIPLEESRLRAVFGADYERYQSGVRRWL